MQDRATPQETAVTGIAAALDPLQPDEAMVALVEMQAVILASAGILPGTPEFDRIAIGYLALLSERVHAMNRAIRAGAH